MRMEEIHYEAEQQVMEDLVNALLAEQFFEGHSRVEHLSRAEWEAAASQDRVTEALHQAFGQLAEAACVYRWKGDAEQGSVIVFSVEPAIVQSFRYRASTGLVEARIAEDGQVHIQKLGPLELMRHLQNLYADDPVTIAPSSMEELMHMLRETMQQLSWSLENKHPAQVLALPQKDAFLAAERKAAFRDRPFHPVSKVKLEWGKNECRRYTIEYGSEIRLNWMAVKRERLMVGQPQSEPPAERLLSPEERQLLDAEMTQRGLDREEFVPIPVHPWQMAAVLPKQLRAEMEKGICVPLATQAGTYSPTTSVRSLLPAGAGTAHVKLPVGIRSLGGLRYLSAVKLMNGQCAERLLRQAAERDAGLQERLFLCDETNWWAYLPENGDLFADSPRHLSAMVRQYPADLLADEEVRLILMSALAVYEKGEGGHLFDEWLDLLGLEKRESSILHLCQDVFLTFFEVCFRLFRLGMLPEVHGQNVVLVWRRGRVTGVLLRDHDSLRVHVPWLHANGLEDPAYTLRPGVPESLYHQTPEGLFAFFQMLGIHVNSNAILDSLSRHFGIREETVWTQLQECLEQAMQKAELPAEVQAILRRELFEQAAWPWKQVMRPLLKHHAKVPSSMPYAKGEAPNPFHAMARVLT